MSFLSWFKELSTQSSGPPTVDNNHPRGLKTCRHTLSRFWNCETHGPGTRSQNSLHKWSFWFLQRTGQGGFLNKILIIFLIRFSQTRKVTTCVKRETSPKTWQWPEGTWKDALSISHQGDANQNPLRYHLTPTKTAIIKNNSKEAGDAAIKIHVPAFGVGIHSSSQAQISKNYWVMWWLLNLRNKTSRTISHSPQPWTRSAVSPHPHQDLFTVFFDTYVHTGNLHKTFTAASLTTGGNNPEACGLWMDEHTVVCPYNGVFVIQPYTGLKYPTHVQHGEPWKQARWKKPDIKHHLLHGSIYMKCPKQANPWDRK